MLGRGAGIYAIWDLHAGGQPIRTFPLTDAGWTEAWLAFRELEGPGAAALERVSGRPDALQPRRAGQIVGRALVLWWRNLRTLITISAVLIVPVEAVLIAVTLANLRTRVLGTGVRRLEIRQPELWVQILDAVVRFLVVAPLLTAALLSAIAVAILGRRPSVRKTIRTAGRKAVSVLWVIVLSGLVSMLPLLPGFATLVGAAATEEKPLLVLAVVLMLVGAVGGIFIALRLLFSSAVVIIEGVKGAAALRRSWNLARGLTWKLLGTSLLVALIIGAAGLIVSLALLPFGLSVDPSSETYFAFSLAFLVLAAIVQVVVSPLYSVATVLLYLDARVRKEGFGTTELEREVTGLGA